MRRFNVMGFCLKAEEFVDDKLSNWYVRRNRRRFWKSEQGQDKLAAYQTLHTVLVTLTKLFAPVIPFVTETMYQNLVGDGESVHHAEFPKDEPLLIDADLSRDMQIVLEVISLGSAARNAVKIKVRQPLGKIRVFCAHEEWGDQVANAVKRFREQIEDELNIEEVRWFNPDEGFLVFDRRYWLADKTTKPKFGSEYAVVHADLQKAVMHHALFGGNIFPEKTVGKFRGYMTPKTFQKLLDRVDEMESITGPQSLKLDRPDLLRLLSREDVLLEVKPNDEDWTMAAERGTGVLLQTTITEELRLKGLAREVVRCVQNLRKDSELQLEDRIGLHLKSEAAPLASAIEKHRDYIMAETLTTSWSTQPLAAGAATLDTKIEGHPLHVELRKV